MTFQTNVINVEKVFFTVNLIVLCYIIILYTFLFILVVKVEEKV
jgi:hypothetical protein